MRLYNFTFHISIGSRWETFRVVAAELLFFRPELWLGVLELELLRPLEVPGAVVSFGGPVMSFGISRDSDLRQICLE